VKFPVCVFAIASTGAGPPPELVKAAVTVSAALIVTEQVRAPVDAQFVKPENVKFVPGAAVSMTELLPVKLAVQVVAQAVIPAGELVTLPVPAVT
jgi:hypothetical protein